MVNLSSENWIIKNIDTVIFDKDGTFIDLHKYWGRIIELRVRSTIAKYNIDEVLFSKLCMSFGYDVEQKCLIENAPIALLTREEIINNFMEELSKYGVSVSIEEISKIFIEVHEKFLLEIDDYVEIIEEAKVLIEKLYSKGVKMAVVTADTRINAEVVIRKKGLDKYFSVIIGKEDTKESKATGIPALLALNKLNSARENTIAIGDAPMDYLMAKNAHLKDVILVATGQMSEKKLKEYSKTTIKSLEKIKISK